MNNPPGSNPRHFTAFRSAAEEVAEMNAHAVAKDQENAPPEPAKQGEDDRIAVARATHPKG
jgi:hypothetical protein